MVAVAAGWRQQRWQSHQQGSSTSTSTAAAPPSSAPACSIFHCCCGARAEKLRPSTADEAGSSSPRYSRMRLCSSPLRPATQEEQQCNGVSKSRRQPFRRSTGGSSAALPCGLQARRSDEGASASASDPSVASQHACVFGGVLVATGAAGSAADVAHHAASVTVSGRAAQQQPNIPYQCVHRKTFTPHSPIGTQAANTTHASLS